MLQQLYILFIYWNDKTDDINVEHRSGKHKSLIYLSLYSRPNSKIFTNEKRRRTSQNIKITIKSKENKKREKLMVDVGKEVDSVWISFRFFLPHFQGS